MARCMVPPRTHDAHSACIQPPGPRQHPPCTHMLVPPPLMHPHAPTPLAPGSTRSAVGSQHPPWLALTPLPQPAAGVPPGGRRPPLLLVCGREVRAWEGARAYARESRGVHACVWSASGDKGARPSPLDACRPSCRAPSGKQGLIIGGTRPRPVPPANQQQRTRPLPAPAGPCAGPCLPWQHQAGPGMGSC